MMYNNDSGGTRTHNLWITPSELLLECLMLEVQCAVHCATEPHIPRERLVTSLTVVWPLVQSGGNVCDGLQSSPLSPLSSLCSLSSSAEQLIFPSYQCSCFPCSSHQLPGEHLSGRVHLDDVHSSYPELLASRQRLSHNIRPNSQNRKLAARSSDLVMMEIVSSQDQFNL